MSSQTFDELFADIEEILNIDYAIPDDALKSIMPRFFKLQGLRYIYDKKVSENADLMAKIKDLRLSYYLGRLSPKLIKEQGWQPYQLTLTKTEASEKVLIDKYFLEARNIHDEYKRCLNLIDDSMRMLKSVSYDIKTTIEYQKFIEGA